MFFSPMYSLLSIVGLIIVFIPQMFVKSTYSKFSKVKTQSNATGADIARAILENAGVRNVTVEATSGELTDHYDPSRKVIRLSEGIFYGNTVAAYGVAAHEVGHAIQDARGYLPMRLRAGIFPAVQAGQMLGPILLMAGLGLRTFMGMGGFTDIIAIIGIVLYASVALFQIITLPVEFNASYRALNALSTGGYVQGNEIFGAKKVLTAAALTYVAAALYAIIELAYWIYVLFGRRED